MGRGALSPDAKERYQILKGAGIGFGGGANRKFLGLTPGHVYKLSIRMNTLAMTTNGDWRYSFHAAVNAPGVDLTPDQMAGLAPLPDGSSGPAAGRVAQYNSKGHPDVPPGPPPNVPPGPPENVQGAITNNRWIERTTDENPPGPGKVIGNITIPPGADTITCWLRLEGSGEVSGVGMDWIALEDLTCSAQLQAQSQSQSPPAAH